MTTLTPSSLAFSESTEDREIPSARMEVFCSPNGPEVFESVVRPPQIWEVDRFDVPSIHAEAREVFTRLLRRASASPAPTAGRSLLLHGEAGSGKTHLLHAFRKITHGDSSGYFGYMQMTTEAGHYGRYILTNLITSLEQPYFPPKVQTPGLIRLSTGLMEAVPRLKPSERENFQYWPLADLPAIVHDFADRLISTPRFGNCDLDLLRALIYLQRSDPRLKARVLMWLRCEPLNSHDRQVLGDLVPRDQEEHPLQMVIGLGRLMCQLHGAALVICIDQLEDIFSQQGSIVRFRKAIDALMALSDAMPTAVIVVACLEDYYKVHRDELSHSKLDRLEHDPEPLRLTRNAAWGILKPSSRGVWISCMKTRGLTFRASGRSIHFGLSIFDCWKP